MTLMISDIQVESVRMISAPRLWWIWNNLQKKMFLCHALERQFSEKDDSLWRRVIWHCLASSLSSPSPCCCSVIERGVNNQGRQDRASNRKCLKLKKMLGNWTGSTIKAGRTEEKESFYSAEQSFCQKNLQKSLWNVKNTWKVGFW